MSKKNIQIIIAFSFLALIGTIGIQYYWISKIYQQNHLLFIQNTNNALKHALKSLETEENLFFTHDEFKNVNLDDSDIIFINDGESTKHSFEVLTHIESDNVHEKTMVINSNPELRVEVVNEEGSIKVHGEHSSIKTIVHLNIDTDSIVNHFEHKSDSLIRILKYRTVDLEKEKVEIEASVEQLLWEMDEFSRPFQKEIPKKILRKVLDKAVLEYKLPKEFEFAYLNDKDSIKYSSIDYANDKNSFTFFANIFPHELISRNQSISIQFKNNPLYIKLFVPIALSLTFTIILLFGFILIIKNMLHHRNVSKMKSDFINNMTHEFKTPIATISLASDSILSPSIVSQKDKVGYFIGMIKKENKRMNRLVERILQMARLENKELELEKSKIDVHTIINLILENTKMKLKTDGKISAQLDAQNSNLMADHDHITNVIYNLIDNAIKYSEQNIDVLLKTYNTKSFFYLSITDKGKGIDKKDIPHIFDRFYRVESGNVHNVKGYGLGLTYVKAIIEKHNGSINVNSEIGKGTSFEIKLPQTKN